MKLVAFEMTNFRSYKGTVRVLFEDLTVFVGKNDIGKSTVLEAMDIFFNDGKGIIKPDKSDINVEAAKQGVGAFVLSAEFIDLPPKVIIDSSYPTDLAGEYLLTRDGTLKVSKMFGGGTTNKVSICAYHPSNPVCCDLLLKKNSDLKKIIKENSIPCEDQKVNSIIRKTIWNYYSEDLKLQDCSIDADKEDAKKIWVYLAPYLPMYTLFQSDRKNSDKDSEVQDPLKAAVKQIFRDEELQETLKKVADTVDKKLHDVSSRTLDKLREMDPAIANSLNPVFPEVEELKWEDVFKAVSITGDDNIPINKRGSGVKRLILLNFFRAEAERALNNKNNNCIIYAIEEPETSQHAKNQNLLIEALKSLSTNNGTQVILTTHSSLMVKKLNYNNLRLIENNDKGEKEIIHVKPSLLKYPSLNEVNYLAFDEISEEYHDELYGELVYKERFKDYKKGKPLMKYFRENKKNPDGIETWNITLTEYIRHQIHHPENRLNRQYTSEELKISIDLMRDYLTNMDSNS